MKKHIFLIFVFYLSLNNQLFAQFGKITDKVIAKDGYWRDFDTLQNVELDLTMQQVYNLLGEPNQLIGMYKDEGGNNIEIHKYIFKEKSTKNAIGIKPNLMLQKQPTIIWAPYYSLNFYYKKGKLWKLADYAELGDSPY